MANVGSEIVYGMFFLTLSNTDVDFLDHELRCRTYPIEDSLPTTRRIKLVGKKEFTAGKLDPEYKTYLVQVGTDLILG